MKLFAFFKAFRPHRTTIVVVAAFVGIHTCAQAAKSGPRGNQFISFNDFSKFSNSSNETAGETIMTSPEIQAGLQADQLIVSWNVELPADVFLNIEARAIYPERPIKYFTMGRWCVDSERHPRESVLHQKDADGDVSTDTLELVKPAQRFQVRLVLGGKSAERARVKFLGLSFTDTKAEVAQLPAKTNAWGKTIEVPGRSQMDYPNGKVLCSPTTVSMLMTYWSKEVNRPELDRDVPEVAKAVYDANWHGTGNWPFNTAYVGSYPGMRAYVTRMSDVSELEDWIAQGLPVGLSVSYDRLRDKGLGGNGHLVVCVGFTKKGDVIVNDPGTRKNVRKTFPRKNLIHAWSYSRNTVYLIYPEGSKLPEDRFGHWESRRSQ